MATDFPNSPSNGDTHAGFTYNSTTGAWESSAAAGGGSGVTSHANLAAFPASPSEGDLAYAEDTDALYLRKPQLGSEYTLAQMKYFPLTVILQLV